MNNQFQNSFQDQFQNQPQGQAQNLGQSQGQSQGPAGGVSYDVVHRTLYEYVAPVSVSHHVARLEPRVTAGQACGEFSLEIHPRPARRRFRW